MEVEQTPGKSALIWVPLNCLTSVVRTHAPRVVIRPRLRQPFGATALFPFFDFGSRKHFEGHFESGVLLFVLVAVTDTWRCRRRRSGSFDLTP
jgi:hypothetical protein